MTMVWIITAAALVGKRNHTIHVEKITLQVAGPEVVGHIPSHRSGTVHARYNAYIIAGTSLATRPSVGAKGILISIQRRQFGRIFAKAVIPTNFPQFDIMCMDPLPRLDVGLCKPNDLAILDQLSTGSHRLQGDLVPSWNGLA